VSTAEQPRILVIDASIPDPLRDAMPNTAHIPPLPGGGGEF
jgi:hypothetical protein